jgi:hypothetical protein
MLNLTFIDPGTMVQTSDAPLASTPRSATLPRYFFNIHDGIDFIDWIGSEHSGMASVRTEAIESLSERTRGKLLLAKDVEAWVMNVRNESGVTVLIVTISAAAQFVGSATEVAERKDARA